jgi:hypothetical protein
MATASPRARADAFVGRADDLAALDALVRSGTHTVTYVHGVAGIGKSNLVGALIEGLGNADVQVVQLDCRAIEPTERGLFAALAAEDLESFIAALGSGPIVVALDHYEVFRLMDTWLRQVLVPALPPEARLLLTCREQPVAAWFSIARGFRSVPVGPMTPDDAALLLGAFDIGPGEARRINRIAHGHPLALTLAGAGILEQPQRELEEAAIGRVIDTLARLYLEDVDDPLARRALEAASVVRRTTEPLLGAMLDGDDAAEALRRLLQLPFVEAGRDGLVVHEAVRGAIGGFLRGANPVRHRSYRRAAWRELRDEVRDAAPSELWRYTADMLYLIENPVVREAFFPSDAQPLAVEPARPDDAAAVKAIAERHEPPSAAAMLAAWWDEAPGTFSVIRDRDSVVAGFFSLLANEHFPKAMSPRDPVVEQWTSHLRENPVPKGQRVLGLRRWLDSAKGEQPCAVQAASWLDVKRTYMALRPALRRIYVVVEDVPTYWPVVEKLGFRPIAEQGVEIDGREFVSVMLDFGPGSVDGWLAGLVGAELGVHDDTSDDETARELRVRGERVGLTPLEFGLFNHLRQCEGKAVSRQELLREVWGTDYAGGSNVVDAVVRSLRRKLGNAASVVETVRGSGYRLRTDWRADLR